MSIILFSIDNSIYLRYTCQYERGFLMTINLKNLKNGDFFTLKDIEYPNDNQLYVKGDYDRSSKTYTCYCFGDINKFRSFKGDKVVYIGFTF